MFAIAASTSLADKKTREKISNKLKGRINKARPKTKEDIIKIANKYLELKSYRKVDRYFEFSNGTTGKIIKGLNYADYQKVIKDILNKK